MIQRCGRVVVIGALCSLACDSYRSLGPAPNAATRAPYDESRMSGILFDNYYYVVGMLDAHVKGDSIEGFRPGRDHNTRFAMPLSRVSKISTMQPSFIRELLAAHFGTSPVYESGGWITLDGGRRALRGVTESR